MSGEQAAPQMPPLPQFDPYDRLAPYYDLGMGDFDADIGLYLGFAGRSSGTVLELGCGTGRLALALARAGHRVIGVDRSAAMLARAREKLSREPELPVTLLGGDMRVLGLNERFGMVAIPLDGFLHLQDSVEQVSCLSAAGNHLDSGGSILVDLPGPASGGWEDWSPGVRPLVLAWSAVEEGGARVNKYSSFEADAAHQTHSVTEIYERQEPDGLVRRWTVEYRLRYVFPAELEFLLEAAGLYLEARYGDYDLAPFVAESPRQICVARAPTGRLRARDAS